MQRRKTQMSELNFQDVSEKEFYLFIIWNDKQFAIESDSMKRRLSK